MPSVEPISFSDVQDLPPRAIETLSDSFESILNVNTHHDFLDGIVSFANRLGFDKISVLAVYEATPGKPKFSSIGNFPASFTELRSEEKDRRDPVMQHVRQRSVPIVWNQLTYTSNGGSDLWEEQAAFGYKAGISLAMHLPAGRHFAIGVERDQPLPTDRSELSRLVADLQLFAVHAQEASVDLFPPTSTPHDLPSLTTRETEALRWTMAGKTAWEVGKILNIAERTAVVHINNAMRKLDSTNKHQAVIRALKLGLIA
jgi:DNA-binding CsgD family transcriptional regulator